MSKQIITFGLLLTVLGLLGLGSGLCTVNAKEIAGQNEDDKAETAANALADRNMQTGWVDVVSVGQIIIDDTLYLLTDETSFPSGRDNLGRGGFVEFSLGQDNYVTQIAVAIPSRSDVEMRRGEQFSRTAEEPEETPVEQESQPRLENGVWVN
jgi:hypothetical protein